MNLCNIKEIKPLLERYGFRFSKSMGQNFLIASWVPQDIAEGSGAGPGYGVLEIGPGIGCLTKELSALADKVVSVELDKKLIPVLAETLSECDNVEIINSDILKTDIEAVVKEKFEGLTPIACANLPYNITTPVLSALIDTGLFESITVMIQREVAHRICSRPGTADYGAFTVYANYYTEPEILFDVTPDCFIPAPKVTSSVIRLTKRTAPPAEVENEKLFFSVIKAAFAQRRKTLVNGLSFAYGSRLSKEQIINIITSCGFDEKVRGETLGISQFAALSNALNEALK